LTATFQKAKDLRAGGRYLPDNIQKAIDDFTASKWIAKILAPTCRDAMRI